MAFHLIKGAFHPGIGIPDGDSVRFAADDISLWDRLEGQIDDPDLRDTLQLRFESIDAIEKSAIQYLRTPRPMSGFKQFIRNTGERVDHLQTFEVSRLDNFIEVQGDTVRMTEDPKLLRVQSGI